MAKRRSGTEHKTKGSENSKDSQEPKSSSGARRNTTVPAARIPDGQGTGSLDRNAAVQRQGSTVMPEAGPTSVEFNARVARRAYDLFERRGREEGHDVEDWLAAERLVNEELRRQYGAGT